MRPELRLAFEQQEAAAPVRGDRLTNRPHYSVNIYCQRPDMDDDDNLDGVPVRADIARLHDATEYARDLARRPDLVRQFIAARAEMSGVDPDDLMPTPVCVVVNDWRGAEAARFPVMAIHAFIGVYACVFVKDAPASCPPFDIDPKPLFVVEIDEAEQALDFAENRAKEQIAKRHPGWGVMPPNGVVVRDHLGTELGRFPVVVVESKPRCRTPWFWRMLGY